MSFFINLLALLLLIPNFLSAHLTDDDIRNYTRPQLRQILEDTTQSYEDRLICAESMLKRVITDEKFQNAVYRLYTEDSTPINKLRALEILTQCERLNFTPYRDIFLRELPLLKSCAHHCNDPIIAYHILKISPSAFMHNANAEYFRLLNLLVTYCEEYSKGNVSSESQAFFYEILFFVADLYCEACHFRNPKDTIPQPCSKNNCFSPTHCQKNLRFLTNAMRQISLETQDITLCTNATFAFQRLMQRLQHCHHRDFLCTKKCDVCNEDIKIAKDHHKKICEKLRQLCQTLPSCHQRQETQNFVNFNGEYSDISHRSLRNLVHNDTVSDHRVPLGPQERWALFNETPDFDLGLKLWQYPPKDAPLSDDDKAKLIAFFKQDFQNTAEYLSHEKYAAMLQISSLSQEMSDFCMNNIIQKMKINPQHIDATGNPKAIGDIIFWGLCRDEPDDNEGRQAYHRKRAEIANYVAHYWALHGVHARAKTDSYHQSVLRGKFEYNQKSNPDLIIDSFKKILKYANDSSIDTLGHEYYCNIFRSLAESIEFLNLNNVTREDMQTLSYYALDFYKRDIITEAVFTRFTQAFINCNRKEETSYKYQMNSDLNAMYSKGQIQYFCEAKMTADDIPLASKEKALILDYRTPEAFRTSLRQLIAPDQFAACLQILMTTRKVDRNQLSSHINIPEEHTKAIQRKALVTILDPLFNHEDKAAKTSESPVKKQQRLAHYKKYEEIFFIHLYNFYTPLKDMIDEVYATHPALEAFFERYRKFKLAY